jgi:glutathione synthase/RimK-type ligase-like ATP-grasp enzyme
MRLALATSANLPGWEVDDHPFHDALRRRGIPFELGVWDDPTFDWSQFDTCLIRTTWDYHERRDAFIQWAKERANHQRFFNPPQVIAWNSHKGYLRELAEAGIPLAPTEWLARGSTVDAAALVRDKGWSQAFLKPAVGLCASDTLRFNADEEGFRSAQEHLETHLPEGDFILQPYLKRVEVDGEISALFFGGVFSHAVQKIPVPGDYRVQDDWGATDKPISMHSEQKALAARIIKTAEEILGCSLLYARVDLMFDDKAQLVLTELELIEPSLFFRHGPQGPDLLVDALLKG